MLDTTVSEVVAQDAVEAILLPLNKIHPKPEFNHRRHFDEAALNELAESIRQIGIVQAVVVRPGVEGGYWLVAGERRWRASQIAGLDAIPAIVRRYDDREALAASVAENANREGISPAEEATLARRAMDSASGDESEAARLLGWSKSTLRARLLLLNATASVLDAQMTGKIKLGHAELLSTLPESLQERALTRLIENQISIDELKKQLSSLTQELAAAPFDTRGCAGCPKNSSTQAGLFEQHVGEGRCSDKACWDAKTNVHLDSLKAEKATEFNIVFFDREKDPGTFLKLVDIGVGGVGEAQFAACKGCASNGAMICTRPGQIGRIAAPVCFNTTCNSEKVKAYAEEQAAAVVSAKEADAEGGDKAKAGVGPVVKKATNHANTKPAEKAKAKSVADAPQGNLLANLTFLRDIARDTVLADEHLMLAAEVFALASVVKPDRDELGLPQHGSFGMRSFVTKSMDQLRADKMKLVGAMFSAKTDEAGFASTDSLGRERVKDSAAILAIRDVKLSGAFKLTKEYLETLTKSGIEALLVEADFAMTCDGDTPEAKGKAFAKLVGGKRGDLIDAVMNSGHDFSTFVPSLVTQAAERALRGDEATAKKVTAHKAQAASNTQE